MAIFDVCSAKQSAEQRLAELGREREQRKQGTAFAR